MARRYDHNRVELKKLAIDAGHDLIKENGLKRFSARSVARKIGYTIGTIFNIFEDYDDLILNINAKTLDIWYEELLNLDKSSKKGLKIIELAYFYIDFSVRHKNEWLSLFEYSSEKAKIPTWYISKMQRFFDYTEKLVLPHVSNNKKLAKRSARILWSGIHGICILSSSQKLGLVSDEPLDILIKHFIDIHLKGLRNS